MASVYKGENQMKVYELKLNWQDETIAYVRVGKEYIAVSKTEHGDFKELNEIETILFLQRAQYQIYEMYIKERIR